MTKLFVPDIENNVTSLHEISISIDCKDIFRINGHDYSDDDHFQRKFGIYFGKDFNGFQLNIKGLKEIFHSEQSITLGMFCALEQARYGLTFNEDWASVTITGDVLPHENTVSLRSVEEICTKFDGVKRYAEQHPEGKHLFIYVSDETELTSIDIQNKYQNIITKKISSGGNVDKVFLFLFNFSSRQFLSNEKDILILDELQQQLLDKIDVNRNGNFKVSKMHKKLKLQMETSSWKGYIITGEGERGKSATAAYFAKQLTITKRIYAPLWVKLDNEKLRELFSKKKETKAKEKFISSKQLSIHRGFGSKRFKEESVEQFLTSKNNLFTLYLEEKIKQLFIEYDQDITFHDIIEKKDYVLVLDDLEQDILDELLDELKDFFYKFNWHPFILITSRCSAESLARKADWQSNGIFFTEVPIFDAFQVRNLVYDIAISNGTKDRLECSTDELEEFFKNLNDNFSSFPGMIIIMAGLLYKYTVQELTRRMLNLNTKENEEKFEDLYGTAFELLNITDKKVLFAFIGLLKKEELKNTLKDRREIIDKLQECGEDLSKDEIIDSLEILVRRGFLYSIPRFDTTLYSIKSFALVFFLFNDSVITDENADIREKFISLSFRFSAAIVFHQPVAVFKKLFAKYELKKEEFCKDIIDLNAILFLLLQYDSDQEVIQLLLTKGADANAKDTDGDTPLFYAAGYSHDISILKKLITFGADIHYKTNEGFSLLHCAAMNKHIEVLKYVLSLGFYVDLADNDGCTALCWAVSRNSNIQILKSLISIGADIYHKTNDGKSLLHLTEFNEHLEIIEYVLSLGFDVNATDNNGWTVLLSAAGSNRNVEVLKKFIALGANIYHKTNEGYSLLHCAAINEHIEVLEYVLSLGFDVNDVSNNGMTPLFCAAKTNSNIEVLKKLISSVADINHKDKDGWSLLHWATENEHIEVLEYVLSLGLDVNVVDNNGWTPLFCAAKNNSNVEFLKKLIAFDADINHKDKDGRTLMHFVAGNGQIEVLEYILSLELDVNVTDNDGLTPLFYAAINNSNVEVLKKLIASGADINHKDKGGWSLLHCAAINEHIEVLEYVLSLGFDVNDVSNNGMTPLFCAAKDNSNVEVLKKLIASGADINHKDKGGWSLLHCAAINEHIEVLEYVLSLGFDVNDVSNNGMTPLFCAAKDNSNVEVLKKLIASGADIKYKDKYDKTLLHCAALNEHVEILEYVLTLGLDVNVVDNDGWSPLFFAAHSNCNTEILKKLKETGADIHHKLKDKRNILHLAAAINNISVFEYILNLGFDINTSDDEGATPIFYTVSFNYNVEVLKKIIIMGADWHHKDNDNCTILHYAATNEHIEILEYVLSLGLDVNAVNNEGRSPLCYAVKCNQNVNIIKKLITCGADINIRDTTGASLLDLASENENETILNYLIQELNLK